MSFRFEALEKISKDLGYKDIKELWAEEETDLEEIGINATLSVVAGFAQQKIKDNDDWEDMDEEFDDEDQDFFGDDD